jgi:hypothetical protein
VTAQAPPLVVVVVLSWNGREDTLACLASLARATYGNHRVVVVDNASVDGSPGAVAERFPGVEVIVNDANLGYAGGMNVGLRRALELDAAHVVLLNNDTEVDPRFIEPLVEEAARRPRAGALCSKVLFAEPRDRIWFAGARFDPRRGYNGRQVGYGAQDSDAFAEVVATDRICGASVLLPRGAVERVGLLDERLFAYVEDVEWSLRARALGLELLVVPDSRVWHRVSASTGGESSPSALYYTTRNTLAVCERHAPLGRLSTWRRRAVLLAAMTTQALLARRAAAARAVLEGWRDYRHGRFGPRDARAGPLQRYGDVPS